MPDVLSEAVGRVRTKIVATLGPASWHPETLRRLIAAGCDCIRINASHSARSERAEHLGRVRAIADELRREVAVLLDLGGPKIRLGPIPGDLVECPMGARFRLVGRRSSPSPNEFTATYQELHRDVTVGDTVVFADGTVIMQVVESDQQGVTLAVTQAGHLRSGQGIHVPNTSLRLEALTEADLADLDWLADHAVEYVGLSFVRSAEDVARAREELSARGCRARVVSKIEKPQAVANFDAILEASDAVMVARGDLGVEVDVARVPAIQKRIIAACHRARVPVIVATQMLQSMERSGRPTRAEASDVFNAVLDGADAVMLSGETAVGEYPVESVRTMSRLAAEAEAFLPEGWRDHGAAARSSWITETTEAIVEAACAACRKLRPALVVVATHSGRTALAVSKLRLPTTILALVDDQEQARALALYWGVTPVYVPDIRDFSAALALALEWARGHDLISRGDRVVLLSGTIPCSTVHNALTVEEVD